MLPQNRISKDHVAEALLPCLLSLPIGLAVGALDALFGRTLLAIGAVRDERVTMLVPLLPLAGLLITWLYRRFGKNAARGMSLVFEVAHGAEREIPRRLVPLVMATTWITHLFGGSAGREGVAVQIGATLSQRIGSMAHGGKGAPHNRTYVVIGMAAGFSGLFRTPIAATLFALEVLHVGRMEYGALVPALLAALCANATSGALGLDKFEVAITAPNGPDAALIVKIMLLGAIFGLAGAAFSWLLARAKQAAAARLPNPYARIAVMGSAVSLAVLAFSHGRYAGLGTDLISASLTGGWIAPYDWIAKLALTVTTLAAGYQGGEVTPLFSIGASLGAVIAVPFGLDPAFAAALGYAAVFGGATRTFLAPTLIGAEVFGYQALPFFFIACALSRTCNFNQSIYSGQKSPDSQRN